MHALRYLLLCVCLGLPVATTSCTLPRLVLAAPYDEQTDAALTALQKDILLHLRALELAKDPSEDRYFLAYRGFYRDIDTLVTRAASRPKNTVQSQQLTSLRAQVTMLESLHTGGFQVEEIAPVRLALSRTFRAILTLELLKK